jgi:hypothetical protein
MRLETQAAASDGGNEDESPSGWDRAQGSAAELTPSQENISMWQSYLPQDCVETMIRMGWDVST